MKSGADAKSLYAKTTGAGRDRADRDPQPTTKDKANPHRETFLAHTRDLAKCWSLETSAPEIRLTLDLTIHADGTIAQAVAPPPSPAAACVEGVAKSWPFERTPSDTTMRVVLVKNDVLHVKL